MTNNSGHMMVWDEITCEQAREALLKASEGAEDEDVELSAKAMLHIPLCANCRKFMNNLKNEGIDFNRPDADAN